MTFKQWFKSTWEILHIDPAGRMTIKTEEFKQYLKEAFDAGKASK